MSTRELERVEVRGRVGRGELKLKDAASILQLSYRQAKRLWRRYREVGRGGLQHGNAGRASHRSKAAKFRRRVLRLIQGEVFEFGSGAIWADAGGPMSEAMTSAAAWRPIASARR